MKKIKKYSKKQKTIIGIGILGVIVLLFLVLDIVLSLFNPIYKVVDRTDKIEEKNELYKEEVVSWVRVKGTNIDYPVIYNDDKLNLDTLNYDFGWTNEKANKLGNRELILGHNLLNVSKNPLVGNSNHKRFEQLMGFIYFDFAEENQYIQYSKNGENQLYKIYSVGFIKDKDLEYYGNNFSSKELENYIKDSKSNSFYNYKVDVNSSDKILSLVTCTRFHGQAISENFIVNARLVRNGENITNYKVTQTKKYDKIKEEMKGDEENGKL